MIGYSIWLAALALAAHVVVRWVAPCADPVLLPVVTALNGLGLAMIYRIDLASDTQPVGQAAHVDHARRRAVRRRAHRAARPPQAAGLHLHHRAASIFLLLLPMVPGLGKEINGARIWIGIGGSRSSRARWPRSAWSSPSPATSCSTVTRWRWPGAASLGIDLPRGRDLGPILAMWLISLDDPRRPARPRRSACCSSACSWSCSTSRPSGSGGSWSGRCCSSGALLTAFSLFRHVQTRVNGWLDPFTDTATFGQIVQGLYGMAWAVWSAPGSARATLAHPLRLLRLHHRLHRRGSSG